MSKYKKTQAPSTETTDAAIKIARSTQRAGQTREQTKLIAQGIQKGIAEFKKQQKHKAREQDKLKKKKTRTQQHNADIKTSTPRELTGKRQWLPWILLIVSWLGMLLFILDLYSII